MHFSGYLSKCNGKLDVPLRAHLISFALNAILDVLYLRRYAAFNSMGNTTIVLLYLSYATPIDCLVFVKGRNNLRHRSF